MWQSVRNLSPIMAGSYIDVDGEYGQLMGIQMTGLDFEYAVVAEKMLTMNGPVREIGGLERFHLFYTGGQIELTLDDQWRLHAG